MPAVGDWVVVCDAPGDRFDDRGAAPTPDEGLAQDAVAEVGGAHPRRPTSTPSSSSPGSTQDFNPRRLERYLTAAWDSGADPVIVLTKLDLMRRPRGSSPKPRASLWVSPYYDGEQHHGRGDRGRACAASEHGQVVRAPRLIRNEGKSTLVNRLAGRTVMETGDPRRDGRGRHTTRHRQLLVMPGRRDPHRHAGPPRAAGVGGRPRQRIRRHRGTGCAVQVQRLRTLDRAGLRRAAKRSRPVSSTPTAGGNYSQTPSGSCASIEARSSKRLQRELKKPLAGACSRDATRPPLRRQALGWLVLTDTA